MISFTTLLRPPQITPIQINHCLFHSFEHSSVFSFTPDPIYSVRHYRSLLSVISFATLFRPHRTAPIQTTHCPLSFIRTLIRVLIHYRSNLLRPTLLELTLRDSFTTFTHSLRDTPITNLIIVSFIHSNPHPRSPSLQIQLTPSYITVAYSP